MAKRVVGMLGVGNIGREVFTCLRGAEDIEVRRIARKRIDARAPAAIKKLLTTRARNMIDDPEIDTVVELTGDGKRGAQYILEALDRGKNVVTANKEAVAKHWPQIASLSRARGGSFGFEATVGGGMPVVRVMERHNSNDQVESFAGILNGTCNFILGRMKQYVVRHMDDPDIEQRSLPLEGALAEATKLGYAEPDPTMDLNGSDTKFKVAILANLAFSAHFAPEQIHCEGIWDRNQSILASDFFFLHHPRYLGGEYTMKLVGVAQRNGGRPVLRVHPALIANSGALADLAGVEMNYNGLVVEGARLGSQFTKGLGAGPKPTAISILSDLREAGSEQPALSSRAGRPGALDRVRTRGFIRSISPDVKGVFAKKLEILGQHKVSVQSIVNIKEFTYGRGRYMPDYIEIDPAPDGAVRDVLQAFRRLRGVREPMYFRILEL